VLTIWPGLFGCDPNTGPPALTLEVEISAPDSVFVGETFEASVTSSGSTLAYDWRDPTSGTISNENAQSPSITFCSTGDRSLGVTVTGAIIPGVPGEGSATRPIHVFPPVSTTVADSNFVETDWEGQLEYECGYKEIPDGYNYFAFRVDDGGISGPYRRLSQNWESDPDPFSISWMDFYHWFTSQTFQPSRQGPIEFVRFVYYAQLIGARQVRLLPVMRQENRTFVFRTDGLTIGRFLINPDEEGWFWIDSLELQASDFVEICSRGGELDFSEGGSPIELGLQVHHSTPDNDAEAEFLFTNIDDFEVQIAAPWSVNDCIAEADPGDVCPDDPDKTDPGACGCGVPDVDSDGDDIPDCLGDCPNIAGTWDLQVSNINSSCGPDEDDWSATVTIAQVGCSLEVSGISEEPPVLRDTIVGNIFSVGPATFDEEGGQTRSTFNFSVTSPTTMTGDESWQWSRTDGDSCTGGTAELNATKNE
jgi:hypothetical protein